MKAETKTTAKSGGKVTKIQLPVEVKAVVKKVSKEILLRMKHTQNLGSFSYD